MATIPVEFVQGLFQGFADLSDLGDAIYIHYRYRAPFIIFDNSLEGFPLAQFILRVFLIGQAQENHIRRQVARLSDFGLTLDDTDLDLMLFALSVFGESSLDFQESDTG